MKLIPVHYGDKQGKREMTEEIFKPIPEYAKRDGEVWLEYFSPSQLEKPLANWVFEYLHLGSRRRDIPVGAPAPAGGAAHDAIQLVVCEGVDIDDAIRGAEERLINHIPRDDLDATKAQYYTEVMGEVVRNGVEAMGNLGDIKATPEQVLGYEHPRLELPIIGYCDFCTSDSIVELKTKWPRPSSVRKDGTRSFTHVAPPKQPDPAHLRQVAFYHAASGKPPVIIYITPKQYTIFDADNCEAMSISSLQRHMEQLLMAAIVRQNLLQISNDPKVLAWYMQPDWNDFRWNIGDELLSEAKELWKL